MPPTNPKIEFYDVALYSKEQHFRMYRVVMEVKEYDYLVYPPRNMFLYTLIQRITFNFKYLKISPPLRGSESIENV